jgi:type VII secretion protein EccE
VSHSSRIIAWQLIAVAAVAAVVLSGPARWALCTVAAVGTALTAVRWHHRWVYEWVRTAWGFQRAKPDRYGPDRSRREAPAIDIAEVRIRGGSMAALLHDGSGFAVVVAVEPSAGAAQPDGIAATALESLIAPGDPVVSAVQFVVRADCAASDPGSVTAAAYRNLGHETVPRSQTTWVVLRHDPMVSGYAVSAVGSPDDVWASLARTLAARGQRAVQLLTSHGLEAELLGADAARAALEDALEASGMAEKAGNYRLTAYDSVFRWWCWDKSATRHVTYRLRHWPAAGLAALQQNLVAVPARSITTAVTLTRADAGHLALSGTVRVSFDQLGQSGQEDPWPLQRRRVRQAAAAAAASMVSLHGQHAAGVLATLPLGREPGSPGPGLVASGLADAIPVSVGGFVIGADPDGDPIVVPLFRPARGTRLCVAGQPVLSRLLALRALSTGASVQVVTTQSASWLRLRDYVSVPPDRMTVVQPGAPPPPAGSRSVPWLVINDTGTPSAGVGGVVGAGGVGAWRADVTATDEIPGVPGALVGLDAIIFEQAGPAGAAAIAAAFGLDGEARRVAGAVPRGRMGMVLPGSVLIVRPRPDRSEQAALSAALRSQ